MDGARVRKNNARIEAYGTVDELNAFIGLIRDVAVEKSPDHLLGNCQDKLFTIGSELATADDKIRQKLPRLEENEIEKLERAMDDMSEELPELRNFIIPGGDRAATQAHVARTVCRRAERRVVALNELTEVDPLIIRYLNRLSDYLFVLARFYTHRHQGEEIIWKSGS